MPFGIPGHNNASSAGWLETVELIALTEKYWDEYLRNYKLLGLFKEQVRGSRKFLISQLVNLLIIGELTSKPEAGKRIDPTMITQKLVEPLFDQYILDLDDDQALGLLNPELMKSYADQESLMSALSTLRNGIATRTEAYMRTLHRYIAEMLSTQGGITLSVSGVDVPINWGFGQVSFAADWDLSTTNIVSEWSDMLYKFKRKNHGRSPNLYILHGRFHRRFILGNDELRQEFAVRHPEIMRGFYEPLQIALSDEDNVKPATVILMSDSYVDESASEAEGTDDDLIDVWPENIGTMAYVDHNEGNFILNSCRTLDNEMKGGLATRMFRQENPASYHVRIAGNHVPSFGRPERVQVCKFSNTVTKPLPA